MVDPNHGSIKEATQDGSKRRAPFSTIPKCRGREALPRDPGSLVARKSVNKIKVFLAFAIAMTFVCH
jgi:hypothetical protein